MAKKTKLSIREKFLNRKAPNAPTPCPVDFGLDDEGNPDIVTVYIHSPTVDEYDLIRDAFQKIKQTAIEGTDDIQNSVELDSKAAKAVCLEILVKDENGERVFEPADIEEYRNFQAFSPFDYVAEKAFVVGYAETIRSGKKYEPTSNTAKNT